MTDSRIKNATGEVTSSEIEALLNTLYIAVDDASFSDFQKILLKSILFGSAVEGSEIANYSRALTPAGFYNTYATEARRGVVTKATDSEVTAKSGPGVIESQDQSVMQAQWLKDWGTANGAVNFWKQSNEDLENGGAVAFQATFKGDLAANAYTVLNHALPTGAVFERAAFRVMLKSDTYYERGTLHIDSHSVGAESTQDLGGAAWVTISADGRELRVKAKSAQTNVKIAATIEAVTN